MNPACQNCGANELVTLYRAPAFDLASRPDFGYFTIARCRPCGVISTVDANDDSVTRAYSQEYYGSPSKKFSPAIEHVLALLATRRAGKLVRRWRGTGGSGKPPSVLDIGCGRGVLLRAFRSQGADVLGLERHEFPLPADIQDFVYPGELSDPALAERRFDIIVLWHVLEHLRHPGALFSALAEHTNKNGLLVIAVPNFAGLQQRLFGPRWFHLDLPRHLVHFEPDWLIGQIEDRGYRIEALSYNDPVQNLYGFLQSALNRIAPGRLNEFYGLLKQYDHHNGRWRTARLLMWGTVSTLLVPFAIIENILALLTGKGATFALIARLEESHDE